MHPACKDTLESFHDGSGVSGSPSNDDVLEMVGCASRVDAPVMISGDSATEHHRLARLIHGASRRGMRRFAVVRCGGLPETVVESKLFGHSRGNVMGPGTASQGVLEMAAGGTVFLDEIGEATPRLQERLFQFLQNREIRRVGDDGPTARVDVRLLTGTTRDLQRAIAAGSFREDLFYRLNVLHIVVPSSAS